MPGTGIGTGIAWRKGRRGGSPTPVGLLNTATGAGATFAPAMRMINADMIGEDIIEVKRLDNSQWQRFPLTKDGIPWGDISDFCSGSAPGAIVPWFQEQSGNGYAVSNSLESECPKIYKDGALTTFNGTPMLLFEGGQKLFTSVNVPKVNSEWRAYAVAKANVIDNMVIISHDSASGGDRLPQYVRCLTDGTNITIGFNGSSFKSLNSGYSYGTSQLRLFESAGFGVPAQAYLDGESDGSEDLSGPQNTGAFQITLGTFSPSATSTFFEGYFAESIIYDETKNSVATQLRTLIASHYGINLP